MKVAANPVFYLGLVLIASVHVSKAISIFDYDAEIYEPEEGSLESLEDGDGLEGSELKIITRKQWNAKPARSSMDDLKLPVSKYIISHTASNSCSTKEGCIIRIQQMQHFQMEKAYFADIAWNFLIGGDGNIYEGRGWNKAGAHTRNHNKESIGIALIGNFVTETPPKMQFDALKLLIAEGVKLKKLSPNYIIYPHNYFLETASPGKEVIKVIKTWPHYVK